MNPIRPTLPLSSNSPRIASRQLATVLMLIMVFCTIQTGCGGDAASIDQDQSLSMRGLSIAYGQYISQHRGRPPKNEKALRAFIESNGPEYLETYGVESIDELLTSPRDNEPYVIVYKKGAKIVAYESVGVDGKRYVADDLGVVEEMDEAAFAEAVPNAK